MNHIVLPTWSELQLVLPEIWLVAAMCTVIIVPFFKRRSAVLPTVAAVIGLVLAGQAVLAGVWRLLDQDLIGRFVLSQMLSIDLFSQFFKMMLIMFAGLVLLQWWAGSRRQTDAYDVPDFLCLLMGALVGMALMASANNLLMIFIAIESASIPSYALAGFNKKRAAATEGSLKYVIFGAASSAIMLYGMSLVYGCTGSLGLQEIAAQSTQGMTPLLAIGIMAMLAGLAFKLSAVPMHFWCPDVFQGAQVEVVTFLSVASKGAAICLLIRILTSFGAASDIATGGLGGLAVGIAILGAVTATWGNLVALHQTNIKRLLAYSSIAHAGYMIMASSLVVQAVGSGGSSGTVDVAGAILFYLLVYLFMNLGAFTAALAVIQRTGSEDIRDYAGLSHRSPLVAILFTLCLLSLFGMPGLGGFMAKIYLMKAMADSGPSGFVLISVLLLNTLVSLYYYLRPIYFMVFVTDTEDRPRIIPSAATAGLLILCATVLIWTGLAPGQAGSMARDWGKIQTHAQPIEPGVVASTIPPTQINTVVNPADGLVVVGGSVDMKSTARFP